MKRFFKVISATAFTLLLVQTASADTGSIGVVNITELFNKSAFVQRANTKLQENVKKMEAQVQAQQKKLQGMVARYNDMKKTSPKKTALQDQIVAGQAALTKMTETYQQDIKAEQNKGMEEYTKLVQVASEKVAKDKHLSGVLSSAAVVYADSSWVDITPIVALEMANSTK